MLKNVPPVISPDLMHAMMSMGHRDTLVIADGSFPAASHAQRLIRADGHGTCEILLAIMQFFPLDPYTREAACVTRVMPGDEVATPIWDDYERILSEGEGRRVLLAHIPRQELYERVRHSYAVVATSEPASYASLLLVKGVIA